jgi:uncharacterized membrane protein
VAAFRYHYHKGDGQKAPARRAAATVPTEVREMHEADFQARLLREVDLWRRDQLITEAQAEAIRDRYAGAAGAAADSEGNRLASLIAFFGATLLGVGVIVFFAANWQEIPGLVKLAAIFAAVLASYAGGYRLRYGTTAYQGTGNALLFLGALLFGAAIFLIAQGLHVNAGEPVLLLLWAVGTLPMAYLLGSRAMAVLMLLNLALALGWELSFWRDGIVPFCAAYLVFGVLLYGLGLLQGAFAATAPFRAPFGVCGLLAILGTVFLLTFDVFGHGSFVGASSLPAAAAIRFAALLAVTVVVLVAAAAVSGRRHGERRRAAGLAEGAACFALLLLGGLLFFGGGGGSGAAVFFNLLLFGLIVGVIMVGCHRRAPAWVNVGTLFFALHLFARYVDWFWDLMPRALFFIGAGTLLLLGGLALERGRRQVLKQVRETAVKGAVS